ncbi:unnamed protein product [Paramecium octaurelia]|uniref:Uncharacterized protein n=1 Tax=Paramecium octaurelia TaxID=43137 RepID=A0A8S1Y2X5_PAROT|nr:unnamed protein product [Paramecium octaurelia]
MKNSSHKLSILLSVLSSIPSSPENHSSSQFFNRMLKLQLVSQLFLTSYYTGPSILVMDQSIDH